MRAPPRSGCGSLPTRSAAASSREVSLSQGGGFGEGWREEDTQDRYGTQGVWGDQGARVILLASTIDGNIGGIPVVNRLVLEAARDARLSGGGVALHDSHTASWLSDWPGSAAAGGSPLRFSLKALRRTHWAKNSVILVTHVRLCPVGRALKRLSGGELVVFLHGVEAWRPQNRRTLWGLRACDRFVSNSHFTLRRFRERNPLLANVPGDVSFLPARPLSPAPSLVNAAPPRVTLVGRLWGRGLLKGQRQLIDLWPQVQALHPDAELWIVGEGAGRADLELHAKKSGGNIVFPGGVSDDELSRIYASTSVYAMPSKGEGFGLVFAEAMAHGVPCVASKQDAGSEVVLDGKTGLTVDPDNPHETLGAILRLLGDADLRSRLGEAGRLRVQRRFSPELFQQRIQRVLQGLRIRETTDTDAE
jgi:phosphatidylinositol alpha-1,6-mannosyltransferase